MRRVSLLHLNKAVASVKAVYKGVDCVIYTSGERNVV